MMVNLPQNYKSKFAVKFLKSTNAAIISCLTEAKLDNDKDPQVVLIIDEMDQSDYKNRIFYNQFQFSIPVNYEEKSSLDSNKDVSNLLFKGLYSLMDNLFIYLLGDNVEKKEVMEFVVLFRSVGSDLIEYISDSKEEWHKYYEFLIKEFNKSLVVDFINLVLINYNNQEVYEMIKSAQRKMRHGAGYYFNENEMYNDHEWLRTWDGFFNEVQSNIVNDTTIYGASSFLSDNYSSDLIEGNKIYHTIDQRLKSNYASQLFSVSPIKSVSEIRTFILQYLHAKKDTFMGFKVSSILEEIPRDPYGNAKKGYYKLLSVFFKLLNDYMLVRDIADQKELIRNVNLNFGIALDETSNIFKPSLLPLNNGKGEKYYDIFSDLKEAVSHFQ